MIELMRWRTKTDLGETMVHSAGKIKGYYYHHYNLGSVCGEDELDVDQMLDLMQEVLRGGYGLHLGQDFSTSAGRAMLEAIVDDDHE